MITGPIVLASFLTADLKNSIYILEAYPMRRLILYHLFIVMIILLSTIAGCSRKKMDAGIPNASFELEKNGHPESWITKTWRGEGVYGYNDTGRTGAHSLSLHSKEGADISWYVIVPVRPWSRYRFSGWIKTENLEATTGRGALFNLHGMQSAATEPLTGTNDWSEVSMEFETDANDALHLNCLFGGWGFATGTAWFDDLSLELISTKALNPKITILGDRIKEPISPYIYGQFIEHLGRCIYGGIWAEMVEDRKFYYPITEKYKPWGDKTGRPWTTGEFPPIIASPWKVLGPSGSVTMDWRNPYVGEQAAFIHLNRNDTGDGPIGIAQEGFALRKDKSYKGRIVLAGIEEAAPIEIRLLFQDGTIISHSIETLKPAYDTFPFEFSAPVPDENVTLEIISYGTGYFKVGTLSLMPDDNIRGWRPEVITLLRELNAPIYRWPGGNFVSGYNWKDGIGDPDKRPPRKNPAWTGVEHNDVGIHEYMDLMELLDSEAFIAVNTGLGTVKEVAEEVEYCNGAENTPMGRLRAKNGRKSPWYVSWWAVGNEMYGGWQLGHMPLANYVKKHKQVAEAMWRRDESIKLVAVGEVGTWSETMMRECADHMTLISEHIYSGERPGVLGHTNQLAEAIRWKGDAHRKYRETIGGLEDKDIRIAMDEWNYWYGPHVFGELGVRYFHKDGLGIAIGLHTFFRNSDLYFMANYAQTVNVIGCIKTTRTEAAFAATGLVLKLYREFFGSIPVEVSGAPEPLDVAAAWTEDKKAFTVAVVNPMSKTQQLPVNWEEMPIMQKGVKYTIAHKDAMAYNVPGIEPSVQIKKASLGRIPQQLRVKPYSITIYRWDTKPRN